MFKFHRWFSQHKFKCGVFYACLMWVNLVSVERRLQVIVIVYTCMLIDYTDTVFICEDAPDDLLYAHMLVIIDNLKDA